MTHHKLPYPAQSEVYLTELLERRAQNVATRYPGQVDVTKFYALSEEGDKYTVMSTPTVVIDDKVIAIGKLLSEEELEKFIKKELEARL
jgi:hypothetical protein